MHLRSLRLNCSCTAVTTVLSLLSNTLEKRWKLRPRARLLLLLGKIVMPFNHVSSLCEAIIINCLIQRQLIVDAYTWRHELHARFHLINQLSFCDLAHLSQLLVRLLHCVDRAEQLPLVDQILGREIVSTLILRSLQRRHKRAHVVLNDYVVINFISSAASASCIHGPHNLRCVKR